MAKRILYLALALSLGINLGLVAATLLHRDPGRPGPGPGRGPGGPPNSARLIDDHVAGITEHLGLSGQQQVEIRRVLERHVPQLVEAQRQAATGGRRLSELFAAPELDVEAFLAVSRETARARARADSLAALMLVG